MDKIIEKLKNTRVLALIGIVCAILGILMPFVKISVFGFSRTISLIQGWKGWAIIVVAILQILICYYDIVQKYIPKVYENKVGEMIKQNQKLSLIPTIILAILTITSMSALDSSYVTLHLGFYLLVISIVSMLVYPFMYKNTKED